MNKKQVLDRINEIIVEEKGRAVTLNDMFVDAQLDSLGTMITFVTIDSEYDIYDDNQSLEDVDIANLTMRDLVAKCILSNTNKLLQPNPGTDT